MRLRTIITVVATLWVGSVAALLATVSPASAVVIQPGTVLDRWFDDSGALITSFDFGSELLGQTKPANLTLEVYFDTLYASDYYLESVSANTTAPFSVDVPLVSEATDCSTSTMWCTDIPFTVYFSPTSEGFATQPLNYTYTISGYDPEPFIQLSGTGVVPLPGALPLFATGLGALGLLTYRRKRKQVAA